MSTKKFGGVSPGRVFVRKARVFNVRRSVRMMYFPLAVFVERVAHTSEAHIEFSDVSGLMDVKGNLEGPGLPTVCRCVARAYSQIRIRARRGKATPNVAQGPRINGAWPIVYSRVARVWLSS